MKKVLLPIFLLFASASMLGQSAAVLPGEEAVGISFSAQNGVNGQIIAVAPDIVRVIKYLGDQAPEKTSLVTLPQSQKPNAKINIGKANATMTVGNTTAKVDLRDGNVQFFAKGKTLLKEKQTTFDKRTSGADAGAYQISQTWQLQPGEAIYGGGIMQDGLLDRRNSEHYMVQNNTEDFVNIFHSNNGYALFWDNYSPTTYKDDAAGFNLASEVGDITDYYFMNGGNADNTIALIRQLTGQVPMAPLWAYGFMQSRERYRSTDELLEVLDKYRKAQVPIDVMIQDWQYWGGNYTWNAMEFLAETFDNAQEMIDKVHDNGAKIMISIWSSFGPQTKQYAKMKEKGMLFPISTWPQSAISHSWPPREDYPSGVMPYDVYNAEARDIYWDHLQHLADMGLDGWWMDSTEPDHLDIKDSDYEISTAMGSFRKVRNAYPLMGVEGVYKHNRNYSDQKRVFILTRSVFAGQQRTGANTWSGDVFTSWENLRKQVPAGIGFSLTGNPNFNHDLGGFFAYAYGPRSGEECGMNNPVYRELYVRWLQQGVFLPMMRSHGESFPREFYYYGQPGEPVYDALVDAVRLRYSLIPYIYSTAYDVSQNNGTFIRGLMMDFPHDKLVVDKKDSYMFGRSLLTAPILHAQYTTEDVVTLRDMNSGKAPDYRNTDFTATKSTDVYLPKGTAWYDFNTNKKYAGGQTITIPTQLSTMPLFVKAGSIVPVGPDVQYTGEKKWDDLEIRVYPGANGEFVLYEDEGDNYNYEKGAYTTIKMQWNDKKRQLTIAERQGEFPGMLQNRKFNVRVVKDGVASDPIAVPYDGKQVQIDL